MLQAEKYPARLRRRPPVMTHLFALGPEASAAIVLSLRVSFWAMLCSLPFALATAVILARCRFWGKSLFDGVVHLPLVLPPVVTGYVLLLLFGHNGPLGRLFATIGVVFAFRWTGAALAAAVTAFPLMVRAIRLSLEAIDQPDTPIIIVSGDDWHEGIIGLVAGKLAEEVGKPVLVLSNDRATRLSRGSARSQKDFNIIEALRGFAANLERYGGHAQAAGFTIRSDRIEDLRAHLAAWKENGGAAGPAIIDGTQLPDQTGVVVEPENPEAGPPLVPKMIDLVFTKVELLNYNTCKAIRALGPFGAGNPEPVFKMEGLRLLERWLVGANKQHLRLNLGAAGANEQRGQRLKGTLTHGAARQQSLEGVSRVNVIFRLESSDDESRPDIWLRILDVEAEE